MNSCLSTFPHFLFVYFIISANPYLIMCFYPSIYPSIHISITRLQVRASLSLHVRPDLFDLLPPVPNHLLQEGAELHLLCLQPGTLRSLPSLEEVRGMKSFSHMHLHAQIAHTLPLTRDRFTSPGSVQLVNGLRAGLEADYHRITMLQMQGLFEVVDEGTDKNRT